MYIIEKEVIIIDVLQAIKQRRSIHQFKTDAVPDHLLTEIFTYATWAPTHYMKEPWEVKVFQSEGKHKIIDATIRSYQRLGIMNSDESEKTLKSIQSIKDFLFQIPHHALIYLQREEDPVRYEEEYAAVCAFIQNAQLAAWEYGVGMLWTITPYMHDPLFAKEVGVDSNTEKIAAVMQIGYPAKINPSKGRTAITEKLEFIRE